MKLNKIKISSNFKVHPPKNYKIVECFNGYIQHGEISKEIYLDKNDYLVDGYVAYLIAKKVGLSDVSVRYGNKKKSISEEEFNKDYRKNETCYIWGKHPNNPKEYIWRVPRKLHESGWDKSISIGDMCIARTSKGGKPMIVTRIEVLNECPTYRPVKKIIDKVYETQYKSTLEEV